MFGEVLHHDDIRGRLEAILGEFRPRVLGLGLDRARDTVWVLLIGNLDRVREI